MTIIPYHAGEVLRRCAPSGPTLLIVGIIAGLVWPALAQGLRPIMSVTIFIFVLGTFLRLDVREFIEVAKKPYVSVALPIMAMIVCPLVVICATWCLGLDEDLSFAMALAAEPHPRAARRLLPGCWA